MRGLDGKARIFIGSSSEGKAAAETTASALEGAGMRPLLWSQFFKTPDLPLQELDRRMADADGAILVGSADDRLMSRGTEFDQMRDNVLLEYGLFAGHLGRHRCILLMPDDSRFRVPSDLLGVAGFELYTEKTLDAVAREVFKRLQAAFAADGFRPPSLHERCRRLLLVSGWMRGEFAKIRLEISTRSLNEQLGDKVEAIMSFLKEDIDELGLREDATVLTRLVTESLGSFPHVPDREELRYRLRRDVEDFMLHEPQTVLPIEDILESDLEDMRRYILDCARRLPVCSRCQSERSDSGCWYLSDWSLRLRAMQQKSWNIRRSLHSHFDETKGAPCIAVAWCMGTIGALALPQRTLGELDQILRSLERWQEDWIPEILDRLGIIEQAIHKQIFGHL